MEAERDKKKTWVCAQEILKKVDIPYALWSKIIYSDPNVIEILYKEQGIKSVNLYLKELAKGKKADKSKIPFALTYNLSSIWSCRGMTLGKKIIITRFVMENRHVANIECNFRTVKRLAAFFAAAVLAIGIVPKLMSNYRNKSVKENNQNSIENTIDEDRNIIESDIHIGDKTAVFSGVNDFAKQLQDNINSSARKFKETYAYKEVNQKEQNIKEEDNSVYNNANDNKENVQLGLGSLLKLPEGLKFSEGVSGGRTGTIGDAYSPTDGVYVIDHIAEVSNQGISNQYGLEGNIKKTTEGSQQYVHISYVHGAKTVEEARKMIEKQNADEKNGIEGQKVNDFRGWVSLDEINKIVNNVEIENDIER